MDAFKEGGVEVMLFMDELASRLDALKVGEITTSESCILMTECISAYCSNEMMSVEARVARWVEIEIKRVDTHFRPLDTFTIMEDMSECLLEGLKHPLYGGMLTWHHALCLLKIPNSCTLEDLDRLARAYVGMKCIESLSLVTFGGRSAIGEKSLKESIHKGLWGYVAPPPPISYTERIASERVFHDKVTALSQLHTSLMETDRASYLQSQKKT